MPDIAPEVKIYHLDQPDDLFHKYPNESEEQPCVLSLDLTDGSLTAHYAPEIGNAKPMDVHLGHIIWVRIPCLTATAANKLLDDVSPYARRVLAGSSIKWDGNNLVGRQTDDAEDALDEITALCDEVNFDQSDLVRWIEASDQYINFSTREVVDQFGLTADTTDKQLAAMARKAEVELVNESESGYTVLLNAEPYLDELREDLRQAKRDRLAHVAEDIEAVTEEYRRKIRDLRAERDELIRRLHSWNSEADTDRTIGDLADLSHTAVQKIAKRSQATN